jgi:hypothetical protein
MTKGAPPGGPRPCRRPDPGAQHRDMRTHERRRDPGRLTRVWSDRLWPVMSGAVTAVGVVALWRAYGLLGTVLAYLGFWFLLSVTLVGVLSDSGLGWRRAALAGRVGSLVTLVLIGLLLLFPVGGWLAVAVCAASSPWAVGRVLPVLHRRRNRRDRRRATAPAPLHPTPGTPGQSAVDRTFEEIVSDLGWEDP